MSFLQALKAEVIGALACDVCSLERGVLNSLCAVWSRTPLGLFAEVNVRLPEIVRVLLVIIWSAQGFEELIRHNYLALLPRTGGVDGVRTCLDAVVQIFLEAVSA